MSHAQPVPPLVLWQYPPAFGLPSLSPFCLKVEIYLRLCGLDYRIAYTNNPRRGPHGKMPVLNAGDKVVADSRLIVAYLNAVTGGGCDRDLTPAQAATGHALQRTLEEHLYFAVMHSRWVDDEGYAACRREFAGAFPRGTGGLALAAIRRMLVRQCRAQGFGRLAPESSYRLAVEDLDAAEALLTGPLLFGMRPTSFDATLYAFLLTIASFPVVNPLRERVRAAAKLQVFARQMERLCGLGTVLV
jgi:glutathione S-transferase